jgi:hypothetical protein
MSGLPGNFAALSIEGAAIYEGNDKERSYRDQPVCRADWRSSMEHPECALANPAVEPDLERVNLLSHEEYWPMKMQQKIVTLVVILVLALTTLGWISGILTHVATVTQTTPGGAQHQLADGFQLKIFPGEPQPQVSWNS